MTFGYCMFGQHEDCIREYEQFYFGPVSKKNKTGLVLTGEMIKCQCPKRGCKCYVPAKDRDKPKKRKKK